MISSSRIASDLLSTTERRSCSTTSRSVATSASTSLRLRMRSASMTIAVFRCSLGSRWK